MIFTLLTKNLRQTCSRKCIEQHKNNDTPFFDNDPTNKKFNRMNTLNQKVSIAEKIGYSLGDCSANFVFQNDDDLPD